MDANRPKLKDRILQQDHSGETVSLIPVTALSYPYIHVHDLNDFKASLLYWDRVRRIVPDSVRDGDYAIGDSAEARRLVDEELLIATPPNPYEKAASERFFQHIAPHHGRFQIDLETAKTFVQANRGIHIEKLGDAVLHELERTELAHQVGDWVGMHDEVGALYMYCLAAEMGQQMNAPLMEIASDEGEVGQALLFEPSPLTVEGTAANLVQLNLGLPSSSALNDISLDKLIAFHHGRSAERLAFRTEVEKILDTARTSNDQNAVSDYLHSQRNAIETSLNDYRRTMQELTAISMGGVLKVSVPSSIVSIATAFAWSPEVALLVGGAGIAISLVACVAETRGKLRAARRASPLHYKKLVHEELLGTL